MLLISGMRGNVCRDQITGVLESVAGVKKVEVNLYRARATIRHDQECKATELIRSVLEAGYGASLSEGEGGAQAIGTRDRRNYR
ncbi:MAG: heavy-metal-associated domain-containing protein [Phycisphaeraceae bacterium]|nr:heavy-metal-associated domain-containing protein [Phycisphaeraceae bacterium]